MGEIRTGSNLASREGDHFRQAQQGHFSRALKDHPVEVLGGDSSDISYRSLIHLATTLAGQAEDPSRILALKSQLESLAKEGEERADGM